MQILAALGQHVYPGSRALSTSSGRAGGENGGGGGESESRGQGGAAPGAGSADAGLAVVTLVRNGKVRLPTLGLWLGFDACLR